MKLEMGGGNRRGLIALAVAAGLYFLVSQLALPAYDGLREKAGAVGDKEDQLRRFRTALSSRDRYTQTLDQVKKSVTDAEARLVRGDNASLASVELQTIVEEAAKKINIALGARSVTPPKKKDEYFNEITMTLAFEGTPNQMSSFLAELRAAPKFVTVRSLQVSPVTAAQEAPIKGELKKTVRVNVTVAALLAIPPVAGKG